MLLADLKERKPVKAVLINLDNQPVTSMTLPYEMDSVVWQGRKFLRCGDEYYEAPKK